MSRLALTVALLLTTAGAATGAEDLPPEERWLAQSYTEALATLSEDDPRHPLLQKSQEAWNRWRDADCDAQAMSAAGVVQADLRSGCRLKLAQDRARALNPVLEEGDDPAFRRGHGNYLVDTFTCDGRLMEATVGISAVADETPEVALSLGHGHFIWPIAGVQEKDGFCSADVMLETAPNPVVAGCPAVRIDDSVCPPRLVYWDGMYFRDRRE